MSVKPSALWKKREGYDRTAASLRGQQLLHNVNHLSKGQGEETHGHRVVFAESLVARHDFSSLLDGTRTLG
jgi:hypothetical protein